MHGIKRGLVPVLSGLLLLVLSLASGRSFAPPIQAAPDSARPSSSYHQTETKGLAGVPPDLSPYWLCDASGGPACFNSLHSVVVLSADEAWAAGDNGIALHYRDGRWAMGPHGGESLLSLDFVSPGEGWAVGRDGAMLRWFGGYWERLYGRRASLNSVDMISTTLGWAAGRAADFGDDSGVILRYADGEWTSALFLQGVPLNAVAMVSANDGWAVGSQGTILRWAGGNWSPVASPVSSTLNALAMVSPQEGWAVGDQGAILHYASNEWKAVPSPTTASLRSLAMISATEGWAVGDAGTILHFAGGAWQSVPGPADATDLHSVAATPQGEGWAVGDYGTILRLRGGSWQTEFQPPHQSLKAVDMVSANEGWAVGEGILRYVDASWHRVPLPAGSGTLQSVAMASGRAGWAVGDGGTILGYVNGNWQQASIPVTATLRSVAAASESEAWAAGDGGTILHYAGGEWQAVSSPITSSIQSLALTSPDEGWAAAGSNTILRRTGGSWQVVPKAEWGPASPDLFLRAVAATSSGEAWFVGRREADWACAIVHLKNGSWAQEECAVQGDFVSLSLVPPGEGWIVGSTWSGAGQILSHFGSVGEPFPGPSTAALNSVALVSAEEGWAVGEGGVILHLTRWPPYRAHFPLILSGRGK